MQHPTATTSAKDLLTAQDVAAMLGVTAGWVYAQSRKGRIPTIPLGRYRRYRRDAIPSGSTKSNRPTPSSRFTRDLARDPGAPGADNDVGPSTSQHCASYGPWGMVRGAYRDTLGTQGGGRRKAETVISA